MPKMALNNFNFLIISSPGRGMRRKEYLLEISCQKTNRNLNLGTWPGSKVKRRYLKGFHFIDLSSLILFLTNDCARRK